MHFYKLNKLVLNRRVLLLLLVCIRNDIDMNGMSTRIEDELALIIQLQKKIKEQQV